MVNKLFRLYLLCDITLRLYTTAASMSCAFYGNGGPESIFSLSCGVATATLLSSPVIWESILEQITFIGNQ
jgi:hypothetical protein